jgi:hypothetical protein
MEINMGKDEKIKHSTLNPDGVSVKGCTYIYAPRGQAAPPSERTFRLAKILDKNNIDRAEDIIDKAAAISGDRRLIHRRRGVSIRSARGSLLWTSAQAGFEKIIGERAVSVPVTALCGVTYVSRPLLARDFEGKPVISDVPRIRDLRPKCAF